MLFAGLFGGSKWMDCFYLAFKVPNLLRDLFAEGALSQAFVTTFSKKLKAEGDAPAWNLANKMMTLAAVFMSLVTLAGILAAPWIVDFLTSLSRSGSSPRTYNPEEIGLTVTEFGILKALSSAPNKVFSRDAIIDRLRGPGFAVTDRTIDSHVRNLRGKFAAAGGHDVIETKAGVGYRLGPCVG